MRFLSKIFNSSTASEDPNIQFGRYTDSNKTDEKYQKWDKAVDLFENEKYISSYEHFFQFLTNEDQKNVAFTSHPGTISFTIYQGSKIIEGKANFEKFSAKAKIVISQQPNLGLMRMLLEENFDLKYTKFALEDDGCISLVFDTFVEDGSPHKIYQALKELATEADRKDDILMTRFADLEPVNFSHMREISEQEKKLKYDFLKTTLSKALHEIDHGKLNTFLYPGATSFLILDVLYKLDYLLKPEGSTMDCINFCHQLYFNDNVTSVHDKNKEMIKRVRNLDKVPYDTFKKELYEVKSTFGHSIPEGHKRLGDIIDAQMTDFEWYASNGHAAYAKAICGYIVGFSLYSYALPEPSKAVLHLYYQIVASEYFNGLGYSNKYQTANTFNKTTIVGAVKDINKKYEVSYPGLKINTKFLDFSSECSFCKSYLAMVKNVYIPD